MVIENYIELLANKHPNKKLDNFQLEGSDIKLIMSFCQQLQKKVGFTDRQFELAKKKILEYKSILVENGFNNVEKEIENLRIPLRDIDRTKKVFLIERESYSLFGIEKQLMIGVQFPFSKKMIKHINFLKETVKKREYDKKNKIHLCPFHEINIYNLVKRFKDAGFEIEPKLEIYYQQLCDMLNNYEEHVPGLYGLNLKNVSSNAKTHLYNLYGKPNALNYCLYYDTKELFGLQNFDNKLLDNSLANYSVLARNIVKSNKKHLQVPRHYSISNLINALFTLKKHPVLIIANNEMTVNELEDITNSCLSFMPLSDISVLFRYPNDNYNHQCFNQKIKELQLNNTLQESTKVVVIHDRLPKPLLKSNMHFHTSVYLSNLVNSTKKLELFYESSYNVLHYYDDLPLFSFKQIEKL